MPSDDGLRLEDFHRVQHLRSQAIEPRKHQAIDVSDGDPLGRSTPQHIDMSGWRRDEDVGLQRCGDRNSPVTAYQINLRRSPIAVIINRFAGDRQPFWVYGRDTGLLEKNAVSNAGRFDDIGVLYRIAAGTARSRQA